MNEDLIKLIKEDIRLGKIELLKTNIHLLSIDEKTSLVSESIFSTQKDILSFLINNGIDINKSEKKESNFLINALKVIRSKKNKIEAEEICHILIDSHIDLNMFENYAMFVAAVENQFNLLKKIIQKGSNVHARENQLILSVASTDNIEMLDYVLNLGVPISNSGSDVRIATMKGNKKMVQHLVEKGALINIKNGKGYNAIMVAAMFENLEIVQYLLEQGANIEDVFNYFKKPLKDNNVIFIIDKKVSKNPIVNDWCLEYVKRKTLYQKLDEKLMKETDKNISGKSKI